MHLSYTPAQMTRTHLLSKIAIRTGGLVPLGTMTTALNNPDITAYLLETAALQLSPMSGLSKQLATIHRPLAAQSLHNLALQRTAEHM
jgi:hypothetical protein